MSRRKRKNEAAPQGGERQHSLAERLDAERLNVFKAMSIVDVVRAACRSIEMERDPEIPVHALKAAYDILDHAAGALGVIVDEHGGLPEVSETPTAESRPP